MRIGCRKLYRIAAHRAAFFGRRAAEARPEDVKYLAGLAARFHEGAAVRAGAARFVRLEGAHRAEAARHETCAALVGPRCRP